MIPKYIRLWACARPSQCHQLQRETLGELKLHRRKLAAMNIAVGIRSQVHHLAMFPHEHLPIRDSPVMGCIFHLPRSSRLQSLKTLYRLLKYPHRFTFSIPKLMDPKTTNPSPQKPSKQPKSFNALPDNPSKPSAPNFTAKQASFTTREAAITN